MKKKQSVKQSAKQSEQKQSEQSDQSDKQTIGFYKGFIGSIGRSLISYPFDTIKVWCQSNKKVTYSASHLYRGVFTQMFTNSLLGGLIIQTEEQCFGLTGNHSISGFVSGAICSFVSVPLDFVKIQRQFNRPMKSIIKMNPYIGWRYAMLREAISGAIFFTVFNKFRNKKGFRVSTAAAVAGFTTVLVSHPLDVIKTRIQLGHSFKGALKMNKFGAGLPISCSKSVLMNLVSYFIISKLSKVK